ncbi:hypothetical protein G9A89_011623 [Geosiphon pyriformis]|nr:hypothetical protein G9A89_011623 [Geosiphon pyriformis]
MAEEKIVDKGEIISTCQSIFIPLYDQYMVVIEKKVKDQVQIFEAEATLYKLGEIGLTGDAMPIKQRAYRVPPASHEIIHQKINRMLDNRLIQSLMSPCKPFIITIDASGQALEAVLSQKGPNRREHLVAYTSKSLSPAEKNYGTLALEHLAIYWAVIK